MGGKFIPGIYHSNYTVMKYMIGSGFSTEIYMNGYGFQKYWIYEWGVFWKSQRYVCTQKYRKSPPPPLGFHVNLSSLNYVVLEIDLLVLKKMFFNIKKCKYTKCKSSRKRQRIEVMKSAPPSPEINFDIFGKIELFFPFLFLIQYIILFFFLPCRVNI